VLGDAKSGRDVDPTLRPDSRLAFRRPGRQTHGAHRTQGIIFADVTAEEHLAGSTTANAATHAQESVTDDNRQDLAKSS